MSLLCNLFICVLIIWLTINSSHNVFSIFFITFNFLLKKILLIIWKTLVASLALNFQCVNEFSSLSEFRNTDNISLELLNNLFAISKLDANPCLQLIIWKLCFSKKLKHIFLLLFAKSRSGVFHYEFNLIFKRVYFLIIFEETNLLVYWFLRLHWIAL